MIPKKKITGILLAGGKSSRMGSDKGFLKINEETFAEHIIKAMTPLVDDIIIVSNHSPYDCFNLRRVDDLIPDAGPVSGIYTGLFYSETEINLILSCDIPLVNTAVLKKLIEGYDDQADVIQLKGMGKTMPLIALYKKRCGPRCLEWLQQGERRLRKVVAGFNTKTITLETAYENRLRNINTKDELKALKNEIEH